MTVNIGVAGELEREWARIAYSRRVSRLFEAWQRKEPALARFSDPVALVRFMRAPGVPAEKDAVLGALLAWAREQPVGGRIALEVIRPGLLNLTGRLTRGSRDREELRAIVLLTVWEGIRSYPLERRPRRIAANLLLDALHRTLVVLGRESRWHAAWALAPLNASSPVLDSDANVEGLLDRAVRAGALSSGEAELILESRVDGLQLAELAAREGVSYNTVKVRRQRAERRLLVFLGFRPVPRGQQKRPSSFARVAGAGSQDPAG